MTDAIFSRIPVTMLHVDPVVQRATDPNRAAAIAAEFSPDAAGALVVNQRGDGKYFVIDGAHRLAAAVAAGYTGKLLCIVHQGLPIDQEAALFLKLNDSKLVQAIDKFRVRVVAREANAEAINDLLEEYGWFVRGASSPGSFAAVVALEKVYNGAGILDNKKNYPELTAAVIHTLTEAWQHNSAGAHSAIVGGLGQLFARFTSEVDIDKLSAEMSKTRPVDLVTKAKGLKDAQGGTVPAAMAKVLVGLHNKGRRTRMLPDWRWIR